MFNAKIQSALQYLQDKHCADFAGEYGEPGYGQPESGILFANWNDVPKGLAEWLEKCGFELEWSDEWTIAGNTGKAYRTSPNSYSWESSLVYCDGDYLTRDDDLADIIDACSMSDWNQPTGCVPSWVESADIEDCGFTLQNPNLESGWFPGQTDDPAKIARAAFDNGARRVVFRKTENSQFYCRFECWVEFDE